MGSKGPNKYGVHKKVVQNNPKSKKDQEEIHDTIKTAVIEDDDEINRLLACSIRGELHNNFPVFSCFGFCRKLVRTKTEQGTDKASERNGRVLSSPVSTGFVNFSFL